MRFNEIIVPIWDTTPQKIFMGNVKYIHDLKKMVEIINKTVL